MIERQEHARRSGLLVLAVFVAALFAAIAGLVLLTAHAYGIERVTEEWQHLRAYVLAAKWSAMLLIVWRWPSLARWLGERSALSAKDIERLTSMRWRLATALIVLEVFLGQNLIGRFNGVADW